MFITDLLSVISLIFDIGWMYQNIFYDYYEYSKYGLLSISNFIETNTIDFASYIEILRYLRLVRVLSWTRIFYESQKEWFSKGEDSSTNMRNLQFEGNP
jgi:hypothetical protein